MDWCKEVGEWIRKNIEEPLKKIFQDIYQSCVDASRWLQTWEQRFQQQCREQECNWWCLCCNKWFCWIASILISILKWIVDITCKIIVTVIIVIITIIVQVLKWVVLTVVCLLSSLCSFLFLIAGLALIAVFVGVVALAAPTLAAIAMPILPLALTVAVAALILARLLCEASRCRLWGVLGWALKWSVLIGAILSLIVLSPLSALVVVTLGGCTAALIVILEPSGCRLPRMFSTP